MLEKEEWVVGVVCVLEGGGGGSLLVGGKFGKEVWSVVTGGGTRREA